MMKPAKVSTSAIGRRVRDLLLATTFACGAAQAAHAAPPTRKECIVKARADYDSAVSACYHWASDRDPYVNCLNDAAYAHQTAYQRCQRIVRRPPALPPVEKPTERAPSR